MNRFIVLLRGVMPSGKNRVPMTRLREVLIDAGLQNVRTYIQSGNAVVDTDLPPRELAATVRAAIQREIGPDLPIIVRDHAQVQGVLDGNPFADGHDPSRVFVAFLEKEPSIEKVRELSTHDLGEEKMSLSEGTAYMYIPGQYGKGALSNSRIEKMLGVSATTRNLNTLRRLLDMSSPDR